MITSFVLATLMCDSGVECRQKLDFERLKCRTLSYNDVLNRTTKEYCSLAVKKGNEHFLSGSENES